MVTYKLLQQKLTTIDLNLSPSINLQYQLSRILYYTFSSAHKILQIANSEYLMIRIKVGEELSNLNENEIKELRIKEPQNIGCKVLKWGKSRL